MATKEALLGILQQRMDKCTTEQFWAVGAITALDAFLLTNADQIKCVVEPNYLVKSTVILLALYGLYFIITRHVGYFFLYEKQVDLVRNNVHVPEMFKTYPNRWKGHSLSGVVFYCLWVLVASGATIMAYQ